MASEGPLTGRETVTAGTIIADWTRDLVVAGGVPDRELVVETFTWVVADGTTVGPLTAGKSVAARSFGAD